MSIQSPSLRRLLALTLILIAGTIYPAPNVLIVVADDLGYADLGFLEHSPPDIKTPALDRLAAEGTYFSNAYSTSPICSPSRAGLITGRYQQRWGNYWYGQGGLPAKEGTLAEFLKPSGYRCHKIGKTHLGGGPGEHPLDHGFDTHLGFLHHTWDYIRLARADRDAYLKRAGGASLGILNVGPLERGRGEEASYDLGFTTEIFTQEALKIMAAAKKNEDGPFYVQLEHNAVHMPTYITDPAYARRAGYEQPIWDREADQWEFPFWDPKAMTWKQWHTKWGGLGEVDPLGRKRYLANLMALDDSVGQLLDALDSSGQRENTLVIFVSDNGGTINTYSNNAPLSGYKYMFGEGGIRVPLIVSWPGRVPAGEVRASLVSAMDITPTVLGFAGAEFPLNLDGQSLVPHFKAVKEGHDHLCWDDGRGTWCVRQGDWKLIQSKGWEHPSYELDQDNIARRGPDAVYPKGLLLFNLRTDIGETTDRATEHPEKVAAMKALYEQWRAEMGEPIRVKKKRN